jgi:hypothetical protein
MPTADGRIILAMSWPQLVFGWPTIILALAAFVLAFRRQRSRLGFAGLALAAPFLWYASRAPRGEFYSPAIFVLLVGAAWFLRRGRPRLAAACLAPFAVVAASLALYVLAQEVARGWR